MSQENVETVRKFYERILRGDNAAALACLAPDVDYGRRSGKTAGARVGGGSGAVGGWLNDWEEIETVAEEFIDAGDHVVVTVHESGRGRGSGIEIDGRYFNVLTVRNGKIVRKVEFTQRSEALEAAGLSE
jgi:ketosteroid isomerase-like protein